ncbi:MAG: zinc metallopeptidase [Anaerolineaceae bacterium]|nr:zinc metallopeptidase [Anaerolineaceae bacterium]
MDGFLGGYGLYLLFSLPALLLGFWAQFRVQSSIKKYSRVANMSGMKGAEVARRILDYNNLYDVEVEPVQGFLSDHYDPAKRVLRLSRDVYASNSVAAAGIAAHEAGHAIQHAHGYMPLTIRTAIVPAVQIGSWLGPIIFLAGLLLLGNTVAWVGLALFGATAAFALVTLPVEFDASRRAKAILADSGMVYATNMGGVNSVLNAAALTYVAAAVQAISTLMYYAFLLMGSRDD